MPNTTAEKLFELASPAAQRNIGAIANAVADMVPDSGTVLEIAAGAGYHAAVLAAEHPHLTWQMSDPSPDAMARMTQMVASAGLPNLSQPLALDVTDQPWPVDGVTAVLCCNMIHIAPWAAAEGLFTGAADRLPAGAPLILYGPFAVDGEHTSESNASFDAGLRARDPDWGVREAWDVDALAERTGYALERVIAMPANNMTRVYRRSG